MTLQDETVLNPKRLRKAFASCTSRLEISTSEFQFRLQTGGDVLKVDLVGYKAPKISAQVSVRVDQAYKRKAEGIRRCWEEIARAKGDLQTEGKEAEVDMAHVWRELLEEAVDKEVAFLTGGKGFPRDDDAASWRELLKTIPASHAGKSNR